VQNSITDLNELKQRLRTELAKLDNASLQQPFISGVVDSTRSVMHVLCNFSGNILHILLSTGFKSGKFGKHSCGEINSLVCRAVPNGCREKNN